MRLKFKLILVIWIALLALGINVSAQQQSGDTAAQDLEIVHANDLVFDQKAGIKAMRLIGNVVMKQGNATMYCDSAYFVSAENSMEAFGNVRIVEGDSLNIWSDYAAYDGNTRFAKLRKNVRLKQGKSTLSTPYLDFDRQSNFAYYTGGGLITNADDNSTLYSKNGTYYPAEQMFFFVDSVRMKNEDFTLESERLKYNRQKDIVYFIAPTEIWQDSTFIYCESGFADRIKDITVFADSATIIDASQQISADSIFINNKSELMLAFGGVHVLDTANQLIIEGNVVQTNNATNTSLVYDSALLVQYFDDGDTLRIHGDTLRSIEDTAGLRLVKIYYKVQFYKSDLQGKCDSLTYSEADSLIKMFRDPVLWTEENQITAKYIQLKSNNGKMEYMDIENQAFICSSMDSVRYNQIKGDTMKGFFEQNELRLVKVFGNGETLYYAEENDSSQIGLNIAKAAFLDIYLDSSTVKEIRFFSQPNARLIPVQDLTNADRFLKGFAWLSAMRPTSPMSIFIWKGDEPIVSAKQSDNTEQTTAPNRRQRVKINP